MSGVFTARSSPEGAVHDAVAKVEPRVSDLQCTIAVSGYPQLCACRPCADSTRWERSDISCVQVHKSSLADELSTDAAGTRRTSLLLRNSHEADGRFRMRRERRASVCTREPISLELMYSTDQVSLDAMFSCKSPSLRLTATFERFRLHVLHIRRYISCQRFGRTLVAGTKYADELVNRGASHAFL